MSRSNPQENNPNPATRWFEWNSEKGEVRYYDKDTKEQVAVGPDFTFMLLDQLGSVRGWHDASQSGIYSNEVKDTTKDVLVVKAFKGGSLAEGIYRDIKDRVKAEGGGFNANCYMAYKNGSDVLSIGCIRFKGAALGAWMEFSKNNRADLYKKAIRITGFSEGKKGRVAYRIPEMKLVDITTASDKAAQDLDKQLQQFLSGYLAKNRRDQAESAARHVSDEEIAGGPVMQEHDIDSSDIPFAWLLPLVLPSLGLIQSGIVA